MKQTLKGHLRFIKRVNPLSVPPPESGRKMGEGRTFGRVSLALWLRLHTSHFSNLGRESAFKAPGLLGPYVEAAFQGSGCAEGVRPPEKVSRSGVPSSLSCAPLNFSVQPSHTKRGGPDAR